MKYCLNCEKKLKGRFQKKFCSNSCSAVYNNTARVKPKYCLHCNAELLGRHKRNTYCDNQCQRDYQYEAIKKLVLSDNAHLLTSINKDRIIKKILIEKYGNKCMGCGWKVINSHTDKIPIQLEHKDGHWENCKLSNLELLCPNCHSLTKTFGGANVGNGRPWRRKYKSRYSKKMSSSHNG